MLDKYTRGRLAAAFAFAMFWGGPSAFAKPGPSFETDPPPHDFSTRDFNGIHPQRNRLATNTYDRFLPIIEDRLKTIESHVKKAEKYLDHYYTQMLRSASQLDDHERGAALTQRIEKVWAANSVHDTTLAKVGDLRPEYLRREVAPSLRAINDGLDQIMKDNPDLQNDKVVGPFVYAGISGQPRSEIEKLENGIDELFTFRDKIYNPNKFYFNRYQHDAQSGPSGPTVG